MPIEITPFAIEHLEEAKKLYLQNWKTTPQAPSFLQDLHSPNRLEENLLELVERGFGVALLEEGILQGYLSFLPPRYPETGCKVFHSPLGGSAFRQDEDRLFPIALDTMERQLEKMGATDLALTRPYWESSSPKGFEKDRIDALLVLENYNHPAVPGNDLILEELSSSLTEDIRELRESFVRFLSSPPISRHISKTEDDNWFQDQEKRLFVAKKNSRYVGFFALTQRGRNYLSSSSWSSYGLYVDSSLRGEGIGRKLVSFAVQTLIQEGERFLGTDYNLSNIGAVAFWEKDFHPYAITFKKRLKGKGNQQNEDPSQGS